MAAHANDAHEFPIYNARFRVIAPLLDADGDPVSPSSPDTELSQDCGTFADATNEATEIATSSGVVYVDLINTETDTTSTVVKIASTGAKTTIVTLFPKRLPQIRTGTAQAGAATTITLDSGASAINDYYVGCYVNCTNNTPTNVQGQARKITDYDGSTKVATVATWGTNPSSSTTFEILATDDWYWRVADLQAISGAAVSTTTAQLGVNTVQAGGTAWGSGAITAASIASDAITAAKIATDAITAAKIAADAIGASELAADAVAEIADAVWDEDATAHQTGGTFGQAIGDPGADTTTIYQSVVTDAAGANIAADIIAIEAQTDDIGAAGAGLTAVPWNAAWDAEVQSEVEDALVVHRLDELLNADSDIDGVAPPTVGSVFHELMTKTAGSFTYDQTTDSNEALRDRGDAAWITATGFSTHSAADVWAVGARTLTASTNFYVKKNTALAAFMWKMVDSTDHITPKTGLTVTCQRSIDGAAFANCNTATATEVSAGWYKVDLAASDLNGTVIALKFTAATADQRDMLVITQS